jgi:predicted transposase/invertase (TIGR01784 family)
MKRQLIFKIVGIGLMLNGISTANGALLESNRQNTTGTSSQLVTYPKDRDYERYSIYTQECVEEGRAEGRAEGEKAARVETARQMIVHHMDMNLIVEITKLTREEVEALVQEIHSETVAASSHQ